MWMCMLCTFMLINSAEKIDLHAGTVWFMMVFGGLATGLA